MDVLLVPDIVEGRRWPNQLNLRILVIKCINEYNCDLLCTYIQYTFCARSEHFRPKVWYSSYILGCFLHFISCTSITSRVKCFMKTFEKQHPLTCVTSFLHLILCEGGFFRLSFLQLLLIAIESVFIDDSGQFSPRSHRLQVFVHELILQHLSLEKSTPNVGSEK